MDEKQWALVWSKSQHLVEVVELEAELDANRSAFGEDRSHDRVILEIGQEKYLRRFQKVAQNLVNRTRADGSKA
jgi:hypothetical protein